MTNIKIRKRAFDSIRQEIRCYLMQQDETNYDLKLRVELIFKNRAMAKAELMFAMDLLTFESYTQVINIINRALET